MIGSEGLEGQSRDQMRPKNDELGWLNREDGLQTVRYSLQESHAVSQIGNIKPKVR